MRCHLYDEHRWQSTCHRTPQLGGPLSPCGASEAERSRAELLKPKLRFASSGTSLQVKWLARRFARLRALFEDVGWL